MVEILRRVSLTTIQIPRFSPCSSSQIEELQASLYLICCSSVFLDRNPRSKECNHCATKRRKGIISHFGVANDINAEAYHIWMRLSSTDLHP